MTCCYLMQSFMAIIIGCSMLVWQTSRGVSASNSNHNKHQHHHHHNHHHIQKLIRESYSEVSAYVALHFNDKCKLTVQNCIFRTEWEKVFGGHGLASRLEQEREGKGMEDEDEEEGNNKAAETIMAYFYCQPFLIARFCVDDYMRRSGAVDEWESALNRRCLNGTDGNSPLELFKSSIYRDKCKPFYGSYFDAYNNRALRLLSPFQLWRFLALSSVVCFLFVYSNPIVVLSLDDFVS